MIFSVRKRRRFRISVYSLTLLFLLRTLIPAGFMPASLHSGSPVQLCPQGLSPTEIAALFGHHHQHHHGDASGPADPGEEFNCPLGLALNTGILPASSLDFSLEKAPASLESDAVVQFTSSRLRAFYSRAPPRRSA